MTNQAQAFIYFGNSRSTDALSTILVIARLLILILWLLVMGFFSKCYEVKSTQTGIWVYWSNPSHQDLHLHLGIISLLSLAFILFLAGTFKLSSIFTPSWQLHNISTCWWSCPVTHNKLFMNCTNLATCDAIEAKEKELQHIASNLRLHSVLR